MTVQPGIRRIRRPADDDQVQRLDATFETAQAFRVVREAAALRLERIDLERAQTRQFPVVLDADPWTDGWVATSGDAVVAFIATSFADWNRRLTIWHFYVDPSWRRQGLGRRLMLQALAEGAERGALHAWLETNNFNVPGVEAYGRLGFEITGFDLTLYAATSRDDEFALFLSRRISV